MVNFLKHNNIINQLFTYHNKLVLKSFRRFHFNLFFLFLLKSYKLYLNNLFAVVSNLKLKYYYYLLFSFNTYLLNTGRENKHIALSSFYNLLFSNTFSDFYFTNNLLLFFTHSSCRSSITEYNYLANYSFIIFLSNFLGGLSASSPVSLPTTNKHFTVLKSPHTDKKSREQFVLSNYTKTMTDVLGFSSYFVKYFNSFSLNSFFVRIDSYRYIA